ncbi:pyruvate, phosphate dikinase [Paucibacter sp. B2R-40]|uniref:PEP/pyruvate-binding domain-containing protein n=1 Tax=Paucibacter sp. B2R-40 TaxID=2893554 RepID=UPI0021E37CAE|nr:PEP/pyruvate-binding domain-containing protein [Paucibacter sp. B2R-40]MCV2355298.1 pyruvate, phosphate dikinase [Paucibacter sp. B2R-40]
MKVGTNAELFLIGCPGQTTVAQTSPQRLGFKAFNLLRMAELGLPVPPAFVLGTRFCADADLRAEAAQPEVWAPALQALEAASAGLRFGCAARPLLLSVRSGAPVSMPGMMETLLNIGLNDETVQGLIRQTGNPRLAWDAYRRLIASFGEVVAGLPAALFEDELTLLCAGRDERLLDFAELRGLSRRYLQLFAQAAGRPFPQAAEAQLQQAIAAVFDSWQSAKACSYRAAHGIKDTIGTAVTVQAMVFGNAGARSGAGVGFTRDPRSGEATLWVDFLFNAQGEDVVSGRRSAQGHEQLQQVLPQVWAELQQACTRLEREMGDMQDFEFTVQDGRLYLLQTRDGKRTPQAQARIALDLLSEGVIDIATARRRCEGLDAERLRVSLVVSPEGQPLQPLARAQAASSGVAMGQIVLDEAGARAAQSAGLPAILVRRDAETSDSAALELTLGLLTQNGARTSHAAVVARQMGKVCLVACEGLTVDEARREIRIGETRLVEGDWLSLDGNEACIYAGQVQTEWSCPAELLAELAELRQEVAEAA